MRSLVMLSMLSPQSMNFVTQLQASNQHSTDLFSMAVGRVISSYLTLPSSGIEDVRSYYRSTLHLTTLDFANHINTHIPVDIEKVRYYTECFYYTRYENAYMNPVALISLHPETALADLFGVSLYFSKDEIKQMVDNCSDFSVLVNNISSIIKESIEKKTTNNINNEGVL